MEDDPNWERVRLAAEGINEGNLGAFLSFCSDDIVLHIGGNHPLSGRYRGKETLLELWDRVAGASGEMLQLQPVDVLSDERHLVVFLNIAVQSGLRLIDSSVSAVGTIGPNGEWNEFWYLMGYPDAQNEIVS